MSPTHLKLERIVWRWALLAVILVSAYWLARSQRYSQKSCVANYDARRMGCLSMDQWTGKPTFRTGVIPATALPAASD